jgi:hypothetical protein
MVGYEQLEERGSKALSAQGWQGTENINYPDLTSI